MGKQKTHQRKLGPNGDRMGIDMYCAMYIVKGTKLKKLW